MRYEIYPAPRRDHWAGERYDPNTDKVYRGGYDAGNGQLAPRLGIAYRMNEKTVIRVGGGISVDPNTFRYLRDDYPGHHLDAIFRRHQLSRRRARLRTGIPRVVGPDLNQSVFTLPPRWAPRRSRRSSTAAISSPVTSRSSATPARDSMCRPPMSAAARIRQTVIQNINAAGSGRRQCGPRSVPGIRAHLRHPVFHALQHRHLQRPADFRSTRRFGGLDARRLLHAVARHRLRRRSRTPA